MELKDWYDAIDHNETEKIMKMIDNGFNAIIDNDYAFRRAAYNGNLDLIKVLIDCGANIDVSRSYAIRTCIYHNHLECVKFLIECNSIVPDNCLKINLNDVYCCADSKIGIRKLLVENGVKLDTDNNDLISILLFNKEYEYIKYLIDKGLTIHPKLCDSYLKEMVKNKQYDLIELLIQNGLDKKYFINVMNRNYDETIIYIIFEHDIDFTQLNYNKFIQDYRYVRYVLKIKESTAKMIKFLIENNLPKKLKDEIMELAIKQNDAEIINLILRSEK